MRLQYQGLDTILKDASDPTKNVFFVCSMTESLSLHSLAVVNQFLLVLTAEVGIWEGSERDKGSSIAHTLTKAAACIGEGRRRGTVVCDRSMERGGSIGERKGADPCVKRRADKQEGQIHAGFKGRGKKVELAAVSRWIYGRAPHKLCHSSAREKLRKVNNNCVKYDN